MTDELQQLRSEIDALDKEIMTLLGKRMDVVRKVGKYKKARGIPALDPQRWVQVMTGKLKMAEELGIDQDMIRDIYNRMHKTALELES